MEPAPSPRSVAEEARRNKSGTGGRVGELRDTLQAALQFFSTGTSLIDRLESKTDGERSSSMATTPSDRSKHILKRSETIIIYAPNPSHCVVERDSTESVMSACLDRAPQRQALCSGKDFPLIRNVFQRRSVGSATSLLGQHRINDLVHPM